MSDKKYTINKIDNTLEIAFAKEMTAPDLTELKAEIVRLSQDGPYDILVDLSGTPPDTDIPANLHEYFNDLPFKRYAIFGGAPRTLFHTKALVNSLHEDPNRRFFRNEADARAWLQDKSAK